MRLVAGRILEAIHVSRMAKRHVAAGILPAGEPRLPARRNWGWVTARTSGLCNAPGAFYGQFRAAGSRPHCQAEMPDATWRLDVP